MSFKKFYCHVCEYMKDAVSEFNSKLTKDAEIYIQSSDYSNSSLIH